ncbi:uncharacterized protein YciI [Aeromicrobium panaciterrae]|uniref:Uncharacterized protein YciI n=1 Tax=Aeromicrobium panaciterrae TaxID=363861 RepID=A0ABU1ULR4_9ACTN|nr:hypothetical protein [Aeromicrobium panaciterrae]MDR7086127.1 uncharacterized protein YciI [Aeromicrobium panaciterrae]
MARDPNVPDEFNVYTLVILRRPADSPNLPEEELDRLQSLHLAHRAELREQGLIVANGPFLEQSDESLRGMSIFTCDLVEAARLNELDPLVIAGRLAYEVMEWWIAADTLAFPSGNAPEDRRSLPED